MNAPELPVMKVTLSLNLSKNALNLPECSDLYASRIAFINVQTLCRNTSRGISRLAGNKALPNLLFTFVAYPAKEESKIPM